MSDDTDMTEDEYDEGVTAGWPAILIPSTTTDTWNPHTIRFRCNCVACLAIRAERESS